MAKRSEPKVSGNELWYSFMTQGRYPHDVGSPWYTSERLRPLFRILPSNPRCQIDYIPFQGIGGTLVRFLLGITPSRLNPRMCNLCEKAAEEFPGGAEVETTLLFADIRGSTRIAEKMNPADFSRLINRFYDIATNAVINHNGMVEKLVGDEVTAFYAPGIAGPEHAKMAVNTARSILHETKKDHHLGHQIPVGVGIHTGLTWIGAVRSENGMSEIAVLGDTPNIAARLASLAGPGEILMSEATRSAAGVGQEGLEPKRLELKGRADPIDTWILRIENQ